MAANDIASSKFRGIDFRNILSFPLLIRGSFDRSEPGRRSVLVVIAGAHPIGLDRLDLPAGRFVERIDEVRLAQRMRSGVFALVAKRDNVEYSARLGDAGEAYRVPAALVRIERVQ